LRGQGIIYQFELLEKLNKTGIEINTTYIEQQIMTLREELNVHLEVIKAYVISKGSSPTARMDSDEFQKQFINSKIYKNKRVDRVSNKLVEELYDETGENYFLALLHYRKVTDRLKRYQRLLNEVTDNGRITPAFSINSAQCVYTEKPALTFPTEELEQLFRSKSQYCETLGEVLQFIAATTHDVLAVVTTTVYYREAPADQHQKRVDHVQKTMNRFNAMMDALNNKITKFGSLKIDYEEQKIIDCDIQIEKLLLEEKLDYWMGKILQTSITGNMKIVRNKTFKIDDTITSLAVIHTGSDQYVIRLSVNKSGDFKGSVVMNPEKTGTVFDILQCREVNQVFGQVSILRRAFRHRLELEMMANNGDFLAWEIVNALFKEVHNLDRKSKDCIRFIKSMIFNRDASWVLSEEDAPELTDYKELQSKIALNEIELEMKRMELNKKKRVLDDYWRSIEADRNMRKKTKIEMEEIEMQMYNLEKGLRADRMKARQNEKIVEESVWKILWKIVGNHAKNGSR